MTSAPQQRDRARELFDQALERAEGERAAFLDEACGGDAELRRELDRLVGLHADAEAALRDPVAPISEQPGDQIGHYKLLQKIGEGGFGVVFMAQQEKPIARKVALKIIKLGMDTRQVVARFEQERQALALMDHPNIARVLDAGATATGRPYFVMDLVRGVPITEFCDTNNLTIDERLDLFWQLCGAVQHAHQKGIIHRDLKPSNILVGTQDGRPLAKVIDFGIAKATSNKLTERTLFTLHQQIIGTLQYMSPEQAEGSPDIDTRTDVYSLGVLLYELLSGSTPFDKRVFTNVRMIREIEPPKPSTRVGESKDTLAGIAAHRRTEPKRLGALLRGELDWIVMKALEKDRSRRYASAAAMAEDLHHHLRNEPVQAGPPSKLYKLRKYVQRHRIGVGVLALIVAGIGVFLLALQSKNTELLAKNTALDDATRGARASEAEAKRQESLAEERRIAAEASEQAAKEQGAQAQHEKANVLKLSAFQTLDDLTEEAQTLWPPEPGLIDRYREWVRKAEELVARLPELRASLAEFEQRALPQSAEERALDRSFHPRSAELDAMLAELTWMKRMLGEESWPSEAEVEQALSKETLPREATALNALAWPCVTPDVPIYGSEVRALLLARRALGAALPADRACIGVTLAWANFRLGRFEDALAEEQHALGKSEFNAHPEHRNSVKKLEQALELWRGPNGAATEPDEDARSAPVKAREALVREVEALEAQVSMRRTWRFADDQGSADTGDRWWHHQLLKLVADLASFADPDTGLMRGLSETQGWGVQRRLEFASSVGERTLGGADAQRLWADAIAAIAASPKYGGLRLAPQLGLLPIGADPESGLWEFAHVQSGEPAQRGADGKLGVTENMGLVLVLIPGTTFWMGAQMTDPSGRNYDPRAFANEEPVHKQVLPPFFLSKYEMTQGQWVRATGHNPSRYGPSTLVNGHQHDLTHPVEVVSWVQCMQVMSHLGLDLPSEAQWECGCRGGTETPWWTGAERESLRGIVNLADKTAARNGATWGALKDWPDLDDGWVDHAPAGTLPANPYGLHEVHGNVWEWCRDIYTNYSAGEHAEARSPWPGAPRRVMRGGSFINAATDARAAVRGSVAAEYQSGDHGLRPARAVRSSAEQSGPQPR